MSLTTYTLSGTVYETGGDPLAAIVKAELFDSVGRSRQEDYVAGDGSIPIPSEVTTTANASGVWSLALWSNLDGVKNTRYRIKITHPTTGAVLADELVQMPRSNVSLASIVAAEAINVSAAYLTNLLDVTISSPANGEVLQYDGSGWVNAALDLSTTLADLDDTTLTAPAAGDFLRHNGTAWVDATIADGDIAQSAVTQHQAALSITESQISDLQAYLTSVPYLPASQITSGEFADALISATSVRQHLSAGSGLSFNAGAFALDINGLTTATLDRDADFVPIYDLDAGGVFKVAASSFGNDLSALGESLIPSGAFNVGSDAARWERAYLGGNTITADTPMLDLEQTWNDAGTTFIADLMDITDTASAAGSLLMDRRVGGVSMFSVNKIGQVKMAGNKIDGPGFFDLAPSGTGVARAQVTGVVVKGDVRFGAALNAGNTVLGFDADDTLAQRRGTNPQESRLYNTYTDAGNYERGGLRWSSNVLELFSEAAGTGTVRKILLGAAGTASLELPVGDGTIAKAVLNARDGIFLQSRSTNRIFLDEVGVELASFSPTDNGVVKLGDETGNRGWIQIAFREVAADPADPAEGQSVLWQSDGTAAGDDGDILMKITAGGVTKTATIVDFSAI
ncbi:MAG TPA: hypothetical protein VIG24_02125 [Acidimicrobiia bacterium]